MKRLKKAQMKWNVLNQSALEITNDENEGDETEDEGKASTKAESKMTTASTKQSEGEEDDDDDDEDDSNESPFMLFFQPMSLESILQTTLSIADYRTFSFIMRMKCRQNKLIRTMDKKLKKQSIRTPERKKLLNKCLELDIIYEELINRICELTPNRDDIIKDTRDTYPMSTWEHLLTLYINDINTKNQLKYLFNSVYTRLSQMSNADEMQLMRKYSSDMSLAIDLEDGTTHGLYIYIYIYI